MGSQVSPIVATLYMEHCDRKAHWSASHPCRYWFRFVDDTWIIQQKTHKQAFLDHINSTDPTIKFPVEGNQGNGTIPFLDTLVTPQTDNNLQDNSSQKNTEMDQSNNRGIPTTHNKTLTIQVQARKKHPQQDKNLM